MNGSLWIGIDLGTTGVRCVIFDDALTPLASHYRESPPSYGPRGLVEQDPQEWWQGLVAVTTAALREVDRARVRAMAISSQGITVVPVDAGGRTKRPAMSWLDARGRSMLGHLAAQMEPHEIERRTGKPFSGDYTLPRIAWLAAHEPESLIAARTLFMPMDYLTWRLTGERVTDPTLASGSMYFDIHRGTWDEQLCRSGGFTARLLPAVQAAGTRVGRLLSNAAEELGLSTEVVVAVGGQDQKCAALAAGIDEHSVTVSLGTAAAVSKVTATPQLPATGLASFAGLFADNWISEAPVMTAGAALRWFSQILGIEDFDSLTEEASHHPSAVDGPLFFPHLSQAGQIHPAWTHAPGGVFWGLGLDTDRGAMVRAVMEGVTFEIDQALRSVAAPRTGDGASPESRTPNVTRVRLFGGGARSPLWCQTIADTTGLCVETLSDCEMAAAGAAILAQRACGKTDAEPVPVGATYLPDTSSPLPAKALRYAQVRDVLGVG